MNSKNLRRIDSIVINWGGEKMPDTFSPNIQRKMRETSPNSQQNTSKSKKKKIFEKCFHARTNYGTKSDRRLGQFDLNLWVEWITSKIGPNWPKLSLFGLFILPKARDQIKNPHHNPFLVGWFVQEKPFLSLTRRHLFSWSTLKQDLAPSSPSTPNPAALQPEGGNYGYSRICDGSANQEACAFIYVCNTRIPLSPVTASNPVERPFPVNR